jgi:hypothetical protein
MKSAIQHVLEIRKQRIGLGGEEMREDRIMIALCVDARSCVGIGCNIRDCEEIREEDEENCAGNDDEYSMLSI